MAETKSIKATQRERYRKLCALWDIWATSALNSPPASEILARLSPMLLDLERELEKEPEADAKEGP